MQFLFSESFANQNQMQFSSFSISNECKTQLLVKEDRGGCLWWLSFPPLAPKVVTQDKSQHKLLWSLPPPKKKPLLGFYKGKFLIFCNFKNNTRAHLEARGPSAVLWVVFKNQGSISLLLGISMCMLLRWWCTVWLEILWSPINHSITYRCKATLKN